MIDEEEVRKIIGTDLKPSSILCIGYPDHKRPPKSRRKLKRLDSCFRITLRDLETKTKIKLSCNYPT